MVIYYIETPPPSLLSWTPPPFNCIKINVDAAHSDLKASIAAVARNHDGVVIKVWAKSIPLFSPIQAEATAILWAAQLAISETWTNIIIEGDAKLCFDALSSTPSSANWSIMNIIDNIKSLTPSFVSCTFLWVRRLCNIPAHTAAKLALATDFSFCFSSNILPPPLRLACMADCPLVS
ncbi:uncharacterized protein LOC126710119 [Quercus robur]|uniref:uncharacterized protein LOC126710119 n=1 Tax=Quercus robur TaxID=38942 RepID=UPI002163D9AF|nr:uncharacterized protein LOC126710119 [Quercus robur]